MKLNWSFSIYTALTITFLTSTTLSAKGEEVTNYVKAHSSESHGEVIPAPAADSDSSDPGLSSKFFTSSELAFSLVIMLIGLGYFYQSEQGIGAAQRRKKSSLEAYGKTQPVLVEGSRQFEQHFQKFTEAWTNKIKEIGQPSELEGEEEQKAKREKFNQWLQKYLDSYRSYERELLVMRILDPIYVELMLLELPQKKNQERDCVWKWSVEALSMYKIVKPYLSDSSARMYAKPLRCFYKTVIRRTLEKAKSGKALKQLKQEFEETLEIEKSKRI